MINKTINGFEIQAEIGKGGMATVYLAQNKLGKKAAIKILHSNLLNNEQVITRFNAEARIMLKLEHPNIRQVYDLTEIDGTPVIIMEYLEGLSLKEYISSHNSVDEDTINQWLPQILDAFEFFHKQNIIHRDIKPGNIFITTQNQIKIVDFGIAKSDNENVNTITGQMLGSPNFMSPEQIKNPKSVGKETDYYSLGITLLHAATGELPYSNLTSTFEIQTKIVSQEIPEIPNNLTTNIKSLITALCHKEAKDRITNISSIVSVFRGKEPVISSDDSKSSDEFNKLADKTIIEESNSHLKEDKTIIEKPILEKRPDRVSNSVRSNEPEPKKKNKLLIPIISFFGIAVIVVLFIWQPWASPTTDNKNDFETKAKGTFTDERDGQTYKWVEIGTQIWMAENLNYTGSDIQHITDNDEWENNDKYDGWCYYDNNKANGKKYGALYQWEASKKACPKGWHLPSDAEWNELINYLGGGNVAGGKLKPTHTWYSPNEGATNSSGFSALPGGYRYDGDGSFNDVGYLGYWWSSTETNSSNAHCRNLYCNNANVGRFSANKPRGMSVRCVRD